MPQDRNTLREYIVVRVDEDDPSILHVLDGSFRANRQEEAIDATQEAVGGEGRFGAVAAFRFKLKTFREVEGEMMSVAPKGNPWEAVKPPGVTE